MEQALLTLIVVAVKSYGMGLTQGEAAAALGMSTGAAVSQQLTKWQTVVGKEQRWQPIIAGHGR